MVCSHKSRSSKVNLSFHLITLPALLEILLSALGDHDVRASEECFDTHLRRIWLTTTKLCFVDGYLANATRVIRHLSPVSIVALAEAKFQFFVRARNALCELVLRRKLLDELSRVFIEAVLFERRGGS